MDGHSSALTDQEVAELKARHLACSHLVKGCQDAIIRVRQKTSELAHDQQVSTALRAIEILEDALASWCDTLSILRSSLNRASTRRAGYRQRFEHLPGVFGNEAYRRGTAALNARRT